MNGEENSSSVSLGSETQETGCLESDVADRTPKPRLNIARARAVLPLRLMGVNTHMWGWGLLLFP